MDKNELEACYNIIENIEGVSAVTVKYDVEAIKFSYNNKNFIFLFFNKDYDMPLFIAEYENDYPHYVPFKETNKYKKICLFDDIEYVNSLISFEDKVRISMEKLVRLESLSDKQICLEYQKEFPIYWNRVTNNNGIKYQLFLDNKNPSFQWLNQSIYGTENSRTIRYSSDKIVFNDVDKKIPFDNRKALFLKVIDADGIFPPINGGKWTSKDINEIIRNVQKSKISEDAYLEICNLTFSHKKLLIIFEISGFYIACELVFKNSGSSKLIKKIEDEIIDVIPLQIERCDFDYLSSEIGNKTFLRNKQILLIGDGSLGSYISEELIKSGCTNLTIYDGDKYHYENICRHKYPLNDSGFYKTSLSKLWLEHFHPQVFIDTNNDNFCIEDNVEKYDLIICTIGNSDKQLEFNEYFNKSFKDKPVIYSWLEGDGKSSHAMCSYNNCTGCYRCCFIDDYGENINNKFNVSNVSNINYKTTYCGGTRVAYGTSTLLSATLITLKAISDVFSNNDKVSFIYNFTSGSITKNTVFISKGCEYCNEN